MDRLNSSPKVLFFQNPYWAVVYHERSTGTSKAVVDSRSGALMGSHEGTGQLRVLQWGRLCCGAHTLSSVYPPLASWKLSPHSVLFAAVTMQAEWHVPFRSPISASAAPSSIGAVIWAEHSYSRESITQRRCLSKKLWAWDLRTPLQLSRHPMRHRYRGAERKYSKELLVKCRRQGQDTSA